VRRICAYAVAWLTAQNSLLQKNWVHVPPFKSLNVTRIDTDRSRIYDFPLTFYSIATMGVSCTVSKI